MDCRPFLLWVGSRDPDTGQRGEGKCARYIDRVPEGMISTAGDSTRELGAPA